jgi:hypothetical protein
VPEEHGDRFGSVGSPAGAAHGVDDPVGQSGDLPVELGVGEAAVLVGGRDHAAAARDHLVPPLRQRAVGRRVGREVCCLVHARQRRPLRERRRAPLSHQGKR